MLDGKDNNWLDNLCEEISELLSDAKQVRFNTHKNRKAFTSKIVGLIKQEINKNTNPKGSVDVRRPESMITKPNPNKSTGFAVMTEGMSSKGDDILGVGPNANKVEKNTVEKNGEKAKRGVSSW